VVEILTHAIFLALSGSKLILVIDDEEKILSVVSSMLHTLRYECYAAVDGVEGCNEYFRAKADSRPFSAVLLDTTIPNGISGEEALKLILAEDPDARVILCSGYADGDLFEKPGATWIQSSGVAGVQELQNEIRVAVHLTSAGVTPVASMWEPSSTWISG
jgi:CheY-like chemotaxis protein